MSKKTCLYELHQKLGGKIVDFAGWALPVQYSMTDGWGGILAEHRHCRDSVAIFDTSHMGQFLISGEDAIVGLSHSLTQDAAALPVGRGKYGFLLHDTGTVIDDTILFRLAEEEYFLVVNAATSDNDFLTLSQRLPDDLTLTNRQSWGKLDVQGPESCAVLTPLVEDDLAELPYFGCRRATVNDSECILARTGYTGELGYEIFMPQNKLPALAETLLQDDRVRPAGLGARDSLRLEMGYPLYGHELDEETTPLEANMDFALNLEREFVGVEALRDQAETGLSRELVSLKTEGRRRFDPGSSIHHNNLPVGKVTSGVFSPSLNVAIGMGYVSPEAAEPGTVVEIHTNRAVLPATVAAPPLYTSGTCRTKINPQPK
jgi:aminomethyltransferase